jgi:electron transport complex protein RnfG
MLKNNYFKYAATLAIICLAASGLLGAVFNLTQPKILYQKTQDEISALKEVCPQAADFESVKEGGDVVYYKALDGGKNIVGYAFKAVRKGYSSDIVTMAGMDKDGVISRIKILFQNETPGLGTRVTEVIQKETFWDVAFKKVKLGASPRPWFQSQFDGKKSEDLAHSVQVITGATITSRAVIDSVQEKAQEVRERLAHGG